ncbi:MAG: hypothetical protein HOQ11_11985 [Gemmatimonadaceae bacterium]|nr:hypothetical protein [Gemmatimonadaceae bacterium]NUQ93970.1 hypothetical protein [Gemmatimonadaceae bacterium]NUR32816.1 hypothetical protein [Gemmatimonadaceae bacterium]NUS98113.1 hypothetical protein [Gemmatimonadaceae bacterium]
MKWSMMLLAVGALAVAAPARAQGIPALGAAKAAAQKAANATNANIAEQTGQPVTQRPVNPVNGGASKSAPATANTANASSSKGTAKAAAPAPATPANTAAAKPAPAVTKDTAKKGVSKDTAKKATPEVAFSREVFTYEGEGRRDPFLSLLASGDLRPAYNDLKLVAVAYDPTGRKSVAIMRDVSSNDQYRVRVGQTLGRMRVAQIHPKSVTFTIDEFGYSRQEILALGDSTQRKP